LKEGFKASDQILSEIKEFCRTSLSPYKVPRDIEFRKELPETLVGKVLRRELQEQEASRAEE
jgi:long-chain acyl-CoA synthetase